MESGAEEAKGLSMLAGSVVLKQARESGGCVLHRYPWFGFWQYKQGAGAQRSWGNPVAGDFHHLTGPGPAQPGLTWELVLL